MLSQSIIDLAYDQLTVLSTHYSFLGISQLILCAHPYHFCNSFLPMSAFATCHYDPLASINADARLSRQVYTIVYLYCIER